MAPGELIHKSRIIKAQQHSNHTPFHLAICQNIHCAGGYEGDVETSHSASGLLRGPPLLGESRGDWLCQLSTGVAQQGQSKAEDLALSLHSARTSITTVTNCHVY